MPESHSSSKTLPDGADLSLALFDSLPQNIAVLDRTGLIIRVNAAWKRFSLENCGAGDYSGHNYLDVCGSDPDPSAMDARDGIRQVLDGRAQSFTLEYPCHSPTEQRWFLLNAVPINDGSGAIVTHQDITARRLLEENLRQSNAELEQFAYVASHDLRAPLRLIRAGLHHLAANPGNIPPAEWLDLSLTASVHMDRMILDLLDYCRLDHGPDEQDLTDLGGLLEQTQAILGPALAESAARLTIQGSKALVRGRHSLLIRLFQNLISNSIRYARPQTPPQIHIHWHCGPSEVRIAVEDQGIGIAPEHAERIFRMFQRLHGPGDFGNGTGIGLAACRKIVERVGGRIWLDTGYHAGSRFLITLMGQEADIPADSLRDSPGA